MRILVLAQSRSGSTGFAAWLKSETNDPVMVEPFNPYANTPEQLEEQMNLVKSDKGLILKFVDNMFLRVRDEEVSDPEKLISKFDKVIGLTRDDNYACAYSRLVGELSDNWKGSVQNTEDVDVESQTSKDLLEKYVIEAERNKKFILELPIFQITYEEIYVEKKIDRLVEYLGFEPKNLDYLFENKNITYNWNF